MSISELKIDADTEKTNADTLGGGFTKATGLYPVIIDMAYLGKSAGGAMSLNLHFKVASDKSVVRQTLWVTSGDKKGNKNFYVNKDGKKFLLPGMALADQIAKITTGKPMSELTAEEKTIKLWDRESQSEKPTKVPALVEMINKPLVLGLWKVRENKRTSDGSGGFVNTRDERLFNEIDKVFHQDGFSVAEKEAGAEEAKFHQQWKEKYGDDYVKDNYDSNVAEAADDSLPTEAAADTGNLFN